MKKLICWILIGCMSFSLTACQKQEEEKKEEPKETETAEVEEEKEEETEVVEEETEEINDEMIMYEDSNGDTAPVPKDFRVSSKEDEQTISTGLVIIDKYDNEYVWVPTDNTPLEAREFGSYFSGVGSIADYYDEEDAAYLAMVNGVEKYHGFYVGRYEASKGDNGLPESKAILDESQGKIWVQFAPQDTQAVCEKLYEDNDTVNGFFLWGANWDTCLEWLVDSGNKTEGDISGDSSSWGNYSNDTFSENARGALTGAWEEAKANNIYDLAGNNWEWTQERCGQNYVMRSGGYNLMGGPCPGDRYPAAIRDPLPGNNHHPNVTFRMGLYLP